MGKEGRSQKKWQVFSGQMEESVLGGRLFFKDGSFDHARRKTKT